MLHLNGWLKKKKKSLHSISCVIDFEGIKECSNYEVPGLNTHVSVGTERKWQTAIAAELGEAPQHQIPILDAQRKRYNQMPSIT